jgi:hypothetical protein
MGLGRGDRKVKAISRPGDGLRSRLAGDQQENKGCSHRNGEAYGGD